MSHRRENRNNSMQTQTNPELLTPAPVALVVKRAVALSIRQPWAWLIIHAAKDVENRDWPTRVRGRVLIHASKTMTRGDYEACAFYCSGLPEGTLPSDFVFPTFEELKSQCGGIVGFMKITDCVTDSPSPWFCGRFGFVIEAAGTMPFHPCKGMLGFFQSEHV